jgi:hypothetical protein
LCGKKYAALLKFFFSVYNVNVWARCEVWGSHSADCEDYYLLGYNAV